VASFFAVPFLCCRFLLTHFFATIDRIYQQVTGTAPFGLLLVHSIFQPLQGFFNLIVYRRPQYIRLRRKHPNKRRIWIIKKCLEVKICTTCYKRVMVPTAHPLDQQPSWRKILEDIKNSEGFSEQQQQLGSLQVIEAIAGAPQFVLPGQSSTDDEQPPPTEEWG
jgi:hypothetical protein